MSPNQYIEEAILETLSQSKADYVHADDIPERIRLELPMSDEDKNRIINKFLDKLETEKRVEARRRKDGGVIDWKLSASEASRRGLKKFSRNERLADGEIPGPPNSGNSEDY